MNAKENPNDLESLTSDLSDDQRAYVKAIAGVVTRQIDLRNAELTARLDALEMEFQLFDADLYCKQMAGMLGRATREIVGEQTKRLDAMERKIAFIESVAEAAK